MIKVEEAEKIILEKVKPVGTERVNLDASLGRVLSQDVVATFDLRPFDHSAMDGYAVRSSDTEGASESAPRILEVIEDVPAGHMPKKELSTGEAIRIMTGAPIPKGADAVIVIEKTEKEERKVRILVGVEKGDNIRLKGEDVGRGELAIPKGKLIRPAEIGMLAALNVGEVSVSRRPRVAVLSTGDELVDVGETPGEGKVFNSNGSSIAAEVCKYGGLPINLGIAHDDKKEIAEKIEKGLSCDALVISGGVSVGDYDFVKVVLNEMGMETWFWKVAMKPGKPLLFGTVKGIPVFGLPGNPVSSMVSFELFVSRAIMKMTGRSNLSRPILKGFLEDKIKKKDERRHFIRAIAEVRDGRYFVRSTGPQGSGVLRSMVLANALIIVPEKTREVKKGEEVDFILLDSLEV